MLKVSGPGSIQIMRAANAISSTVAATLAQKNGSRRVARSDESGGTRSIRQMRPSGDWTARLTQQMIRRTRYSHSIVDGGFDEMSSVTRFTPGISLMIRLEIVSSRS
jgi:hypothetical protein